MTAATPRELGRLGPGNLRVELSNGEGDIVAAESGIDLPAQVGFGCKKLMLLSPYFFSAVYGRHTES
jgi:hypothetical protein